MDREDGPLAVASELEPIRDIVRRIESQVDALGHRMVARYREEITDYGLRLAEDEALYHDVREVTVDNVRTLLENLVDDDAGFNDEQVVRTRQAAMMRVHQGISLEAFLHAVRLWGQGVWDTVLETARIDQPEEREAALVIAGRILRHVDLLSIEVARSYVNEVQGLWSARELLRRDLLDALIAGKEEAQRVRGLVRSLGHVLAENYVVALARGAERDALEETQDHSIEASGPLRRILEATRAHLRPAAGSLLVGMRQGEIVVLYPLAGAVEMDAARVDCHALAEALADDGVSLGLGGFHAGLAGVPASYREAGEALETAAHTGIVGRAVVFDDVLIEQVARSSVHSDRILDATLRPLLEYDSARQSELVSTLRAYVQCGFNLTRSAERLAVHPNTVQYRLRRVREVSGRDPMNPDDLLLLFLGLKLIR